MTTSTPVRPSDSNSLPDSLSAARPSLHAALWLALGFAAAKLALQFALTLYTTHLGYSYFRDEFYYIACGRHLAWGYVDHGPIVALQARLGELLFGDSVFAVRVLSALASAVAVFLTGILAWALGGSRPAQALAMLGLILCPQYIGTGGYLSMNSFEPLFWMGCVLALLLLARSHAEHLWWPVFGVSAGIGLLNKPSMVFFLLALALGLLCTPERRLLRSRWAALAVALTVLIVLPNLLWQAHHGWPTLEFLRNGHSGHKTIALNPLRFLLAQIAVLGPVNALLWIPGVYALLRGRTLPGLRWLGLTYLVFFVAMLGLHAKDYYLAPIYPAFFAAGAVLWERRSAASSGVRRNRVLAFPLFQGALLVTTVLMLPFCSPVLRPQAWLRYTGAIHLHGFRSETEDKGAFPQFFADRLGWQQEVQLVLGAFRALSPAEQRRVCIFAGNYGEAGAIDFLGPRELAGSGLHLPPVISGQNNYWLWGTHGCDPNLVIAISDDEPEEAAAKYRSVQIVGAMDNPWTMDFEHHNIYLLRGRRPSMPFEWEDEQFYY